MPGQASRLGAIAVRGPILGGCNSCLQGFAGRDVGLVEICKTLNNAEVVEVQHKALYSRLYFVLDSDIVYFTHWMAAMYLEVSRPAL